MIECTILDGPHKGYRLDFPVAPHHIEIPLGDNTFLGDPVIIGHRPRNIYVRYVPLSKNEKEKHLVMLNACGIVNKLDQPAYRHMGCT